MIKKIYTLLSIMIITTAFTLCNGQSIKAGVRNDEEFLRQEGSNIVSYSYRTGLKTATILAEGDLDPDFKFTSYSISADGKYILLATQTEQIYRHSKKSFYYLFNRTTKKLKEIAPKEKGKQQEATFSPNSKMIAFVRDNNIFIYTIFSGEERQITFDGKKGEIINGIPDWVYEEEFSFSRAYEWSPLSDAIAYWRFDERDVKSYDMTIMDSNLYPRVVSFKYPKAGGNNSIIEIKVCNLNIAGKTISIPLPNGGNNIYIPRISWTNADNKLAIHLLNRKQNSYKLLLADALLGVTSTIYEESDPRYIERIDNRKVTFLPHDKYFIVMNETDGWNHLYLYNYQGRKEVQITSGEWEVIDIKGIDESAKKIYYTSTEEGELQTHLYSISFFGKNKVRLTQEQGTHNITMSPSCMFYQDNYSATNIPNKISLYNHKGEYIRTIVDNTAKLEKMRADTKAPKKEFFKFTTSEGIELNGYILYPANFDKSKKYPILMTQYSGPGSQSVADKYVGDEWTRPLSDSGIIIGCVDGRGTGRRGAEFRKITYADLGHYELLDQIEAAKYFGSLPFIDKSRIGIYGWSFGGFMSLNAILKASDIFAVAIAVAPVTSWRFYDTIYTELYNGMPQDNPEGYDNNSPLNFASGLKGKLLLVHGTGDDNVHIQNTYRMIEELVKAKKDYRLLIYPDKNHTMGSSRSHLYKQMVDFIKENL